MATEGGLFIDRAEEFELLDGLLVGLREGTVGNLCLSGIPGSGKSALLRRFVAKRAAEWCEEGVILVILPVWELGESALDLGFRLVPRIAAAFLEAVGMEAEAKRLLSEDTFQDEARRLKSESLEAFAEEVERFMHTEGAATEEILRASLAFPDAFAAEKNVRFVLFFDDFHLLHRFRLKPGRTAVDLLCECVEKQSDTFFVVTVTPSPFADRYFLAGDAPFHKTFQFYSVDPLPEAQAVQLASEILESGGEPARRVAKLAAGYPLYLTAVARSASRGAAGASASGADVDRAFAAEVLIPWGAVFRHFEGLLLRVLSSKEDLEPARTLLYGLALGKKTAKEDLARECGLDVKTFASMLGRILSLGLFRRVENTYYFDDPLFRFWAVRSAGRKDGPPDRLTGEEATARAEEFLADFLPVRKETALSSRKFNFRALVGALKGKEVPGRWVGMKGEVRFPDFERVQGFAFTSKEIKVYYLTGEDLGWVLLVVWRRVPVNLRVMETFARRALGRAQGLWFIGRGGFTDDALSLARKHGIFCSSENDLQNLLKEVSR